MSANMHRFDQAQESLFVEEIPDKSCALCGFTGGDQSFVKPEGFRDDFCVDCHAFYLEWQNARIENTVENHRRSQAIYRWLDEAVKREAKERRKTWNRPCQPERKEK